MNGYPHTIDAVLKQQVMCVTESGCWIWMGKLNDAGYGTLRRNGKYLRAHRWIYQQLKGPLLSGLELDHLCHTRCCVNPHHLEQVTHQVNADRGLGRKRESCPRGHPMSGDNLYFRPDGKRECRQCILECERRRHNYQGNPLNKNRTHCIHGHLFNEVNTYRPPGQLNKRMCRQCRIRRKQEYRERQV